METQILAARQLGFSIDEMRMLTVGEVLLLCDLSVPEDPDKPGKAKRRKATQADIDRFLR